MPRGAEEGKKGAKEKGEEEPCQRGKPERCYGENERKRCLTGREEGFQVGKNVGREMAQRENGNEGAIRRRKASVEEGRKEEKVHEREKERGREGDSDFHVLKVLVLGTTRKKK